MNMKRIVWVAGALAIFIFLIAYNSVDYKNKKEDLELKRLMQTTTEAVIETDVWDAIKESNQKQQNTTPPVTTIDNQTVVQTEVSTSKNTFNNNSKTQVTTVPIETQVPDETTVAGKKTIFTTKSPTIQTEVPKYNIVIE